MSTIIKTGVKLYNPAKVYSKNVKVTAAADLDLVVGQVIFYDATAKGYKAAAVSTSYATTLPSSRCVIALEATKVGTTAKDVKCIYAGEVYTAGVREAGHTEALLPDVALDLAGGVSGITFVNEEAL